MPVHPPSNKDDRTGAVLAMVLVSLLVASLVGLALVKTLLVHHRQMHVLGQKQQCFWLAEAGVRRAARRLAESPDYRGEEWEVSADVLGSRRPAQVTIEVTAADLPNSREVRVEARFTGDLSQRIGYERKIVVPARPEAPAAAIEQESGQ